MPKVFFFVALSAVGNQSQPSNYRIDESLLRNCSGGNSNLETWATPQNIAVVPQSSKIPAKSGGMDSNAGIEDSNLNFTVETSGGSLNSATGTSGANLNFTAGTSGGYSNFTAETSGANLNFVAETHVDSGSAAAEQSAKILMNENALLSLAERLEKMKNCIQEMIEVSLIF